MAHCCSRSVRSLISVLVVFISVCVTTILVVLLQHFLAGISSFGRSIMVTWHRSIKASCGAMSGKEERMFL